MRFFQCDVCGSVVFFWMVGVGVECGRFEWGIDIYSIEEKNRWSFGWD